MMTKTSHQLNALRKPTARQTKIDKLFEPDKNGCSRWVSREEVEKSELNPGRNGNGRYGIYFSDKRYVWDVAKDTSQRGYPVKMYRTIGFADNQAGTCNIRDDIKKHYRGKPCSACCFYGPPESMVVDHKNDLRNDPRVLDLKTQRPDDFQSLCERCNLRKREVCKKMRETGKRQGATQIHCNAAFLGVDFTSGDDTYDPDDVNATVGTYWHDPIAFRMKALQIRDEARDERRADVDPELFRMFESMNLE